MPSTASTYAIEFFGQVKVKVPSKEWACTSEIALNSFNVARKNTYVKLHERVKRLRWQARNNSRAISQRLETDFEVETEMPNLVHFDNVWFDRANKIFQGLSEELSCKALGLMKIDKLPQFNGCLAFFWRSLEEEFLTTHITPLKNIEKLLMEVSADMFITLQILEIK